GACQAEFQGQFLVPVSGPRQQVNGGTANAASGVPSGNLVSGAKLDDGFRKIHIGISTSCKPANGSGDTAVDAELGIDDIVVEGERASPRLGIAHPRGCIEVPEDLEGID